MDPCPDEKGVWIGRTRADAPDVDGLVFVTEDGEQPLSPGVMTRCEIVASQQYDLIGVATGQAVVMVRSCGSPRTVRPKKLQGLCSAGRTGVILEPVRNRRLSKNRDPDGRPSASRSTASSSTCRTS